MPGRVRRAIVRLRDTTSTGTTRPGMTAAMSRNSRAINFCFALPFLASLIYPGHGQLIPLLIRLLLGVESPVDRCG